MLSCSASVASASCRGCRLFAPASVERSLFKILLTLSTAAVSSSMGLEPGILTVTGNHARQSEMRVARDSSM